MPGPFTITPSTNTVTLDTAQKGTVTFTVTNTTKMRVRGVGRLIATPPETAGWYSVQPVPAVEGIPVPPDPLIRDFAPEGTQTYVVAVTVPPTAAPGEYKFKLTVANEINPDDDFTESAEVGFSIAPKPAPTPTKFPLWIIPVILVLLVLVVVAILLLSREGEPPPPTDTPTPTITPTPTPSRTPGSGLTLRPLTLIAPPFAVTFVMPQLTFIAPILIATPGGKPPAPDEMYRKVVSSAMYVSVYYPDYVPKRI